MTALTQRSQRRAYHAHAGRVVRELQGIFGRDSVTLISRGDPDRDPAARQLLPEKAPPMKLTAKTLVVGSLLALGATVIYLRAWGNKLAGG